MFTLHPNRCRAVGSSGGYHRVASVAGARRAFWLAWREIWTAAFAIADDDAEAMIELGRRWCTVLGTDPATAPEPPDPATPTDPTRPPEPAGPMSPIAEAVAVAASRIAARVARETPPGADDTTSTAATAASSAAEEAVRAAADATARRVFSATSGSTGRPGRVIRGTRAPTPDERRAARRLGRALDTAGIRDRVTTRTTSALPPGRLRMRGALSADAQRAAGATPTAEPFTRTTRRAVPAPPLRLGIACDVSGSMHAFTDPIASAAWILANAAHHSRMPVTTATVAFGARVRAITHPGSVPTEVTEFNAPDDYEAIDTAIDALDAALDLSRPGAARLLVIASDGHYCPEPRQAAQTKIQRLLAAGCGVLWLAPSGVRSHPLDGVTSRSLTNPTTSADTIATAAITALRGTR